MASIKELLDFAEDGQVEAIANPVVKRLKEEAASRALHRLPDVISRERERLEEAYSDENIESTGREIAALEVNSERLARKQGIRQGTNLALARQMYIRGATTREISKETGIPSKELNQLINNKVSGWRLQRERVFETLGVELYKQNLPVLRKIHGMGYALIERSLRERLADAETKNEKVSLAEAQTIANILAFISKEKRLEEQGALKEAEKNLSAQEIVDAITEDPFLGPSFKKLGKLLQPIEVVVSGTENRDSEQSQTADGPKIS